MAVKNEKDLSDFHQNVEMQRRLGVEVEVLTPNEARTLASDLL